MTTIRLYADTNAVLVDRVSGRDLMRGKLKAGTDLTLDGTKVYGPGGYEYRLDEGELMKLVPCPKCPEGNATYAQDRPEDRWCSVSDKSGNAHGAFVATNRAAPAAATDKQQEREQ